MGAPYFNPPHIQKVNTIEQGNFFVPTKGVEEEMLAKEVSAKKAKVMKIVKICALVAGLIAFVILGVFVIKDYILMGNSLS